MVWFHDAREFRADLLAAMVAQTTGGELHSALAPESVWLDDHEHAAASRALDVEMARYGGRSGDVDEPDFRAVAELLSTPPEAWYGWISDLTNDIRLGLLAARSGWFGVIAVRQDDSIWLRTYRQESPSELLAGALPKGSWKSATQPIGVMRSEMLAADDDRGGYVAPRAEVRRAQRIVAMKPYAIAEFYAEVATGNKRRSSTHPIRVYDTDDGRWSLRVTESYADERYDLAPVDHHDITRLLDGITRDLHTR